MNLTWIKFKGKVKGMLQGSAPYRPLLETGDSSPYFGTYEGQRIGGWDTECCWDFSACELMETRLTMFEKMGLIPQDTLDWAKANGYKDSSNDWYISRRWVAILSGVKDNGNDPINFWNIASILGVVPDSMLPYSPLEASKWITKGQFDNDYFNVNAITPEMRSMGQEFLRRFRIQAENLTGGYIDGISTTIQTYLKEGSLQICHPVPQNGSWNRVNVDYPVGRTDTDHATELYKFDQDLNYPFYIYDSYVPNLKQLSKNYYIPIIVRATITPIAVAQAVPLPQFSPWMKFWMDIKAWLTNTPLPFTDISIG